jgi:hypothetical protein
MRQSNEAKMALLYDDKVGPVLDHITIYPQINCCCRSTFPAFVSISSYLRYTKLGVVGHNLSATNLSATSLSATNMSSIKHIGQEHIVHKTYWPHTSLNIKYIRCLRLRCTVRYTFQPLPKTPLGSPGIIRTNGSLKRPRRCVT